LIFVENSFNHGVTTLENSEIKFEFTQRGNEFWFKSSNRKPISNGGKEKPGGVGLMNAERRLELMYTKHNFKLNYGVDGDKFCVELWLKENEN